MSESDPRTHRLTTPEQQKALHDATRAQLAVYETQSAVKAARIKEIQYGYCSLRDRNTTLLVPEDPRLEPIEVSKDFVAQWDPKVPGYFVVGNGNEAWAPAKEFDEVYEMSEQAKPQDLSALLPPAPDETTTGTVT